MLRLSNASRYSIAAVAFLAGQKREQLVTSSRIANALGISEKFLLIVLRRLARTGVLLSMKGPSGGFRLARPAREIALLEIIEAVDGPVRGEVPFIEASDNRLQHKLEPVFEQAATVVRRQFQRIKISDLAGKTSR